MSKEVGGRTIYIALDESNHGKYPEIIAAVSSLVRSDSSVSRIGGRERMSEEEVVRFIRNPQRDYAHISAEEGELLGHTHQLVEAAPCLINDLLKRIQRSEEIASIEVILDGEIRMRDLADLYDSLHEMRRVRRVNRTSIKHYPKSTKGEYEYPRILVAADSLANLLFRRHSFIERIEAEKKRVKLKR